MKIFESVAATVGNTPLVRLSRFSTQTSVNLLGKCEFMNPGGSVKDRIGFHMVSRAEAAGLLRPGGTIVEATAGNTGMGLAMAAATRGYGLVATMTTKMSSEKVNLLKALGAQVVMCPYEIPYGHAEHFMSRAKALAMEIEGAWYADQFFNPENVQAHYSSTGPEIWEQTHGKVNAVIAGMGTGGTLSGIGLYLRQKQSDIDIIMADPIGSVLKGARDGTEQLARPYRVEGIGGDFVPKNVRLDVVTEAIAVSDTEAIKAALRLFRTEGMFVGASAGATLAAATVYAKRPENSGKTVIAMLPDSGRSYVSTIYNEEWRLKYGIIVNDHEMQVSEAV